MTRIRSMFTAACVLALNLGPAQGADPLPPEKITVAKLPPANPHRLYLSDLALHHIVDGRVHIVDGDSFRFLGMISTGLFGITALGHDSSEMLVATTYYEKRNRGKRFDQFEVYDTATLTLKSEVEIPAKHAQALPYKGTVAPSIDGRFAFIQNATPLSSVTVIDRKANRVSAEVPTLGCWIILPAASNSHRFSTLCGDGSIITATLNEAGDQATQQRSAKLFDAEKDALFVQGEHIGDSYYFVSFLGNVHVINLGGETAQTVATWSLLNDEDKQGNWRPGGYQILALHAASKRLYVAMHDGGKEGSHKNAAKEIWAYDIESKQRIARVPGSNAIALAVTKEPTPVLYAYDGLNLKFVRYQTTPELKVDGESAPIGDFAGLVETH